MQIHDQEFRFKLYYIIYLHDVENYSFERVSDITAMDTFIVEHYYTIGKEYFYRLSKKRVS